MNLVKKKKKQVPQRQMRKPKLLEEVRGRTPHLLKSASFPTTWGAKVRGIQRLPNGYKQIPYWYYT